MEWLFGCSFDYSLAGSIETSSKSRSHLDRNLSFHRVCDKTLVMGVVVEFALFLLGRYPETPIRDPRPEDYRTNPGNTPLIFGKDADRLIRIGSYFDSSFVSQIQVGQHMATGDCRDKSLFGIDVRRV